MGFFGWVFYCQPCLQLLQLLGLGEQGRSLLVRVQDGLQGGPLVRPDLLLAVEHVDIGRDLEGPVPDVTKEGGLPVAVGSHQAVFSALIIKKAY